MTDHHLVVALAYDGLCTFEFGCVVEVFALPRPELKVDWYRFAACALERGPIRAAGGVMLEVPGPARLLRQAGTIIIPGWRSADEPPPESLVRALRDAYRRGCRLCSICSGVFVLAAAGVLDGKPVTTHWRYAQKLASRYPKLDVQANALYVDAGQIVTAAGSAAGLDMMLHLVRSDHGARVANQVAQRLVIPPHRDGGQAQFVPRLLLPPDRGRVSKLIDWLRANLRKDHTLETLAARAAMSTRTLHRSFMEATGLSPYEWIVRERVALAKDLLESARTSVGRVAESAGFASEQSFRKHFRRVVGTSPSAYRRQFARA
jgi:AraC family transcriptional activator FtrA